MRQLRYLFVFSFSFILLLTACKNEPTVSDITEIDTDPVVNVRIGGDPESLGYLFVTDSKSLQIIRQIFLPLMDFEPETYKMVPVLAKTAPKIEEITEGEEDLVTFEYEIRPEATWFDGSPVTANDYLFTIKVLSSPQIGSIYASQFRGVKRIEIDKTNPKKFKIVAKKYIMARQSFGNFAPLPQYLFDPNGVMNEYTLNEIRDKTTTEKNEALTKLAADFSSPKYLRDPSMYKGSGPYHLTSWTTGESVVLDRRDNWWGADLSKKERALLAGPSKINYKIIPDVNAAISLMKNGELDVAVQLDWTNFLKQQKDIDFNKQFGFYTPDRYAMRVMFFNTPVEKLSDKRVRRAIAHLFNKEEIFNTVYYGYPTSITSPVYPTKDSYNRDLKEIAFDIEKAKILLKEAGWEDTNGNGIVDKVINGELTELEIDLTIANANTDYVSVATIFGNTALKAGVKISPNVLESTAFFKALKSKEFDMIFHGTTDYPFNFDPVYSWHTVGPNNYSSFATTETDALIKEVRSTIDVEKQNKMLKELQAVIYEEQPCIFLCVAKDRIIASKRFGEITPYGLTPGYFVNELGTNVNVPITSNN